VKSRRTSARASSRARILDATLATLERVGFARTTARSIAESGGFNPALIYYHFESIEDLLIAALQDFSERRLERYRATLEGATTMTALVEAMTRLYQDDVQSGRLGAAQEVVAGSSSSAELGQRVVELMSPWFGFAEEILQRLLGKTILAEIVPAKELAYALVALYFGVETLARMDRDRGRAQVLFDSGARLAPLVDALIQADIRFGPGTGPPEQTLRGDG
jgi:AcrR family transcriptional regulator